MITQPSIDKLIEIAGSKYSLCTVIAKRARHLNDLAQTNPDPSAPVLKPITQASQELFDGKLTITKD